MTDCFCALWFALVLITVNHGKVGPFKNMFLVTSSALRVFLARDLGKSSFSLGKPSFTLGNPIQLLSLGTGRSLHANAATLNSHFKIVRTSDG